MEETGSASVVKVAEFVAVQVDMSAARTSSWGVSGREHGSVFHVQTWMHTFVQSCWVG